MNTIRFFRFLFATLLFGVAWTILSSSALAYGIYSSAIEGNDISYPQCSTNNYPQKDAQFGIIGVTGGKAFTNNACLSEEFAWASDLSSLPSLYMNLNSPIGSTAFKGMVGPYGRCKRIGGRCQAENYGYNAAQEAFRYATSQGAFSPIWWLDIETTNSWSSSPSLNRGTINGAVKFFKDQGISVGIYSVPSMWSSITGNYKNNLPVWIAISSITPAPYCSSASGFTGGAVYLVQHASDSSFDSDHAC
jgi:hypothetical protein